MRSVLRAFEVSSSRRRVRQFGAAITVSAGFIWVFDSRSILSGKWTIFPNTLGYFSSLFESSTWYIVAQVVKNSTGFLKGVII